MFCSRFILRELRENIGRIILLTLISTVLTIIGILFFFQKDTIYNQISIVEAYGLTDDVIVYNSDFISDEQLEENKKLIDNLPCVSSVNYCTYSVCDYIYHETVLETGSGYWFYTYCIPQMKFNPYKMVEGRVPVSPNEIMVSSNCANIKCGDVIENLCYDKKSETGNYDRCGIKQLIVVGIFDINNSIPFQQKTSFRGDCYSGIDTESDDVNQLLSYTGYIFYQSIVDEEGDFYNPFSLSTIFIVSPEDGYKSEDVSRSIKQATGYTGVYNYEEFSKWTIEYHAEDVLLFKTLGIVFIVILLTINVAYAFISLSIKKRELSIYYIHGISWKKLIGLNAFMYSIFVCLGYFIGIILIVNAWRYFEYINIPLHEVSAYLMSFERLAIIGLVVIGSYIVVNVAFYIYTSKKTPIGLLR